MQVNIFTAGFQTPSRNFPHVYLEDGEALILNPGTFRVVIKEDDITKRPAMHVIDDSTGDTVYEFPEKS